MPTFRRTLALTGATGLALAAAVAASPGASAATTHHENGEDGAVFVQNDALTGNQVVAYRRGTDGTLTQAATYATGGLGGRLTGAGVDFTASQGALTADRANDELLAVNAGSDTLSVFGVDGTRLRLRQVVGTAGDFPVSVTAHGDRVFVLNARDGGSIQGYLNIGGRLFRVPSWHRELNLPVTDEASTAEFTHTPGQVAFTPDGRHLVVTTKAATNSILVYSLGSGRLSHDPVVRTEDGAVPFSVAFDAAGHLQVTEAGPSAVASYAVGAGGALTPLGVTPTGQRATCWIDASGNLLAASNAGSASVTTLRADASGATTALGNTATGPGTVDADFTRDGRTLYVQTGGNGGVDAFAVGAGGALTKVGTVTVPDGAGGEGIVAW